MTHRHTLDFEAVLRVDGNHLCIYLSTGVLPSLPLAKDTLNVLCNPLKLISTILLCFLSHFNA